MRHGKKDNHLGRTKEHRDAMLANMANSLIEHKRIFTTLAKAKVLRRFVEPILTRAKSNTTHSRRVVFSYLQNKEAIKELFDNIAAKIADRPGGYVRVLRTGFRQNDAAEMAMIELVDYNPDALKSATDKRRRTRRGRGPKNTKPATTNTNTAATEENKDTNAAE